jgi:hypothetical protein
MEEDRLDEGEDIEEEEDDSNESSESDEDEEMGIRPEIDPQEVDRLEAQVNGVKQVI